MATMPRVRFTTRSSRFSGCLRDIHRYLSEDARFTVSLEQLWVAAAVEFLGGYFTNGRPLIGNRPKPFGAVIIAGDPVDFPRSIQTVAAGAVAKRHCAPNNCEP
jgi:hypothetical protein